MGELRKLNLGNGKTIYVEVDEVESKLQSEDGGSSAPLDNLPRGAKPTSFTGKMDDAALAIRSSLDAVSSVVAESFEAVKPDEWTVELCFGFKGEAGIPVLVKGEASGAIKVSATWKKSYGAEP